MIIIDCPQLSDAWFQEKAGVPSAGSFSKIVTTKGARSIQRKKYLYQLAAEAITGVKEQGYSNANMEEGVRREQESRDLYEFTQGVEVEQVGFVYQDEQKRVGCSPDGFINREWGLELKNVLPSTQVGYLIAGKLPTEYFAQVQGSMLVTGYQRWDFMTYSPGLPPFLLTVRPDEKFLKALEKELDSFCLELALTIKKLKEMG